MPKICACDQLRTFIVASSLPAFFAPPTPSPSAPSFRPPASCVSIVTACVCVCVRVRLGV